MLEAQKIPNVPIEQPSRLALERERMYWVSEEMDVKQEVFHKKPSRQFTRLCATVTIKNCDEAAVYIFLQQHNNNRVSFYK